MTARRLLPALCSLSLWMACTPAPPRAPTIAAAAPAPAPSAVERRALHARGMDAYNQKDWKACAALFEQARDPYSAACCHALGGAVDPAFAQLARAIDAARRPLSLEKDPDLAPLHADPRWQQALARLAARVAELRETQNAELVQLYEDDQADRNVGSYEQIDWSKIAPRDEARRKRVEQILASGGARTAEDYYRAAMVFQHGNSPDEIQRAHDLAVKAVELDPSHDTAKWLAAASEDRKLMYENKPQKWGTQFKKVDGTWVLWTVDPTITDAQRAEWNVPTLAEAQARAAQMNARK